MPPCFRYRRRFSYATPVTYQMVCLYAAAAIDALLMLLRRHADAFFR